MCVKVVPMHTRVSMMEIWDTRPVLHYPYPLTHTPHIVTLWYSHNTNFFCFINKLINHHMRTDIHGMMANCTMRDESWEASVVWVCKPEITLLSNYHISQHNRKHHRQALVSCPPKSFLAKFTLSSHNNKLCCNTTRLYAWWMVLYVFRFTLVFYVRAFLKAVHAITCRAKYCVQYCTRLGFHAGLHAYLPEAC